MAKSDKALDNLKKLYSEQTALNKKILAAEKLYATELKAEAKITAKQAKPAKKVAAKKVAAKKTGAPKAQAKRRSSVAKPAKA
jgi:dimeric dUTPase (all-alpha-NTP-PPase superfamily)